IERNIDDGDGHHWRSIEVLLDREGIDHTAYVLVVGKVDVDLGAWLGSPSGAAKVRNPLRQAAAGIKPKISDREVGQELKLGPRGKGILEPNVLDRFLVESFESHVLDGHVRVSKRAREEGERKEDRLTACGEFEREVCGNRFDSLACETARVGESGCGLWKSYLL